MRGIPKLHIAPYTAIFLTSLALFDRSLISLIPFLAALCHELGHIALIYALGANVREIEITLCGAEIRSGGINLSAFGNIAVYGAGAAANLLSASVAALFSSPAADFFAGCSVVLAIFNLLPIRSLDGGCILSEILNNLFPRAGERIFSVISAITLTCLWLSAVFLLLNCGANASLLLFCVYMFASLYF